MSDHHQSPIAQRVFDAAADGCAESRLLISRRAFLGISASFCSWAFMPKIAEASGMNTRLLIVVLRGGMDGLHMLVPKSKSEYDFYHDARGDMALQPTELVSLNAQFWLNKTMTNFHRMYTDGDAAFITSVAPPLRNRSHFQCQNNLENGLGNEVRSTSDGWLNRLLSKLPKGEPVRTRGALAIGRSPLILSGEAPVLSWSPAKFTAGPAPFNDRLVNYYKQRNGQLDGLLESGLDIDKKAGAPATGTELERAFSGAGTLLARADGPRIAVLSVDDWDTHLNQRALLSARFKNLDNALQSFRTAIGSVWQHTVVACVSEFGRTTDLNGSQGTDHGIGTVALLLGGAVAGGKVHGSWLPFERARLVDNRDLAATTDTRQLFKGILQDHLGVPKTLLDNQIFPGSAGLSAMSGLIQTPVPRMKTSRLLGLSAMATPPSLPPRSGIGRFREERRSRS